MIGKYIFRTILLLFYFFDARSDPIPGAGHRPPPPKPAVGGVERQLDRLEVLLRQDVCGDARAPPIPHRGYGVFGRCHALQGDLHTMWQASQWAVLDQQVDQA